MFIKMNTGYFLVLVYIPRVNVVICSVISVMETRLKYCHSSSVTIYNILYVGIRLHSGNIYTSCYIKLKYGNLT